MSISVDTILSDWKKNQFKPVYWLEGEEGFYIDLLIHYAEHNILTEQEASFNLTVFYGKDAAWNEIMNACRKYPMFADKQIVILKEAQQMRDIEKLEPYIEQPLSSTIFVVGHKEKKLDGRSKLGKLLGKQAVHLVTKKIPEYQLAEWTSQLIHKKGYVISPTALAILTDHIGNDLSRISNEVDKLIVNLGSRKDIKEEDIENFIGVSREFNVFELQAALAKKEIHKAIRIIEYFEHNPKAAPIQMILPALYAFFSKTYMMFSYSMHDERVLASALGVQTFQLRESLIAAKNYSLEGIESILLLLHHYNLRSIGINNGGATEAALLKELVVKMVNA
ncbi:MAG: DNA polymerase III subunit delta [Sphingobacteriales bacterium]|jgi:DNA polymerase-3 subunit delta